MRNAAASRRPAVRRPSAAAVAAVLIAVGSGCSEPSAPPRSVRAAPITDLLARTQVTVSDPIDLGVLEPGGESYARDIDEFGVTVGWARTPPLGNGKPVMWMPGQGIVALPTLAPGDGAAVAVASSEFRGYVLRYIVGWSGSSGGTKRAVRWAGDYGSRLTDLGTLQPNATWQPSSMAMDVNQYGVIVGESDFGTSTAYAGRKAFRWQGGAMSALPLPSSWSDSRATAIDSIGRVAGWAYPGASYADARIHRAFRLDSTSTILLPYLTTQQDMRANGVNQRGHVVGSAGVDGSMRAFHWSNGTMRDLGTLGTGGMSTAAAVNDAGEVVGSVTQPTYPYYWSGFFWRADAGMVPLPALAAGRPSRAWSINNRREIVGESQDASGAWRATMWRVQVTFFVEPRP